MPATLDEQALVRRTLAGDREAYRLIVLGQQQRLLELVFRQTGDRAAAEDLVQETFLRAYQALPRFDPRWRLSTWLARIALNVARDHGRRRLVREGSLDRVARSRPEGAAFATPMEDASRAEARASLQAALGELPEEQREVLVLSAYGGHSQREIADLLEQPLGTVKSRMRAALSKLRGLVAPLHPGGAA